MENFCLLKNEIRDNKEIKFFILMFIWEGLALIKAITSHKNFIQNIFHIMITTAIEF
jgi:hypothetical protein